MQSCDRTRVCAGCLCMFFSPFSIHPVILCFSCTILFCCSHFFLCLSLRAPLPLPLHFPSLCPLQVPTCVSLISGTSLAATCDDILHIWDVNSSILIALFEEPLNTLPPPPLLPRAPTYSPARSSASLLPPHAIYNIPLHSLSSSALGAASSSLFHLPSQDAKFAPSLPLSPSFGSYGGSQSAASYCSLLHLGSTSCHNLVAGTSGGGLR